MTGCVADDVVSLEGTAAAIEEFWLLVGEDCPVCAINSPFKSENAARIDRHREGFTAGSPLGVGRELTAPGSYRRSQACLQIAKSEKSQCRIRENRACSIPTRAKYPMSSDYPSVFLLLVEFPAGG